MICPDCRLHLVGHASCELAAERAADWEAIWAAVTPIQAGQVWSAELTLAWLDTVFPPPPLLDQPQPPAA